jgi:hypothetical protein
MVREMAGEIPAEFFEGITEVVVSPRTVPHPDHPEIFTLGECIPLAVDGESPEAVQSRVVLYHGSFRALATLDGEFDWEAEAWETLCHEVRHHVEWRASRDDLGNVDAAGEANFARLAGQRYDPLFYLDGERHGADLYRVDHDWFLDRPVRRLPTTVTFRWRGEGWWVAMPPDATLPAYLAIAGGPELPDGTLTLVVRHRPRIADLFRTVEPFEANVHAVPAADEEEVPPHGH